MEPYRIKAGQRNRQRRRSRKGAGPASGIRRRTAGMRL